MIEKFGLESLIYSSKLIKTIDPVSYQESILLNYHSSLVLTDSGGILRESYFNKVPAILLDDTTEWIELVKNKWVTITGVSESKILSAINENRTLNNKFNLLGDGTASKRILEVIVNWIH